MQLLETIRVEDGKVFHLPYHQQRLEETLHALKLSASYELSSLLTPPREGLYRCRVLYDESGISISYLPYTPRTYHTLQAVIGNDVEYPFKYADRSQLDALYAKRGSCDDVAIIKNGLLTDTTIANIALHDGTQWVTPKTPLLRGTTRKRLLDEGFLLECDIGLEELHRYRRCAIMNAMLGFVEVENGILLPQEA